MSNDRARSAAETGEANSTPHSMKKDPENSDEQMQYAMLGDDGADVQAKLEKYTGEVDWSYLKKHYESGVLIYVDASLSITEVGQAISEDNTAAITVWKKTGDIVQPSAPHAAHWEESGETFLALVVTPFVLIQTQSED